MTATYMRAFINPWVKIRIITGGEEGRELRCLPTDYPVVSDTSVKTPKVKQIDFILGLLGSKQIDRFSLVFIDCR